MMLELTASGVWKTYDGGEVLKDCSFSFGSQDLYILTGPNGCGKSTFLRICALIEEPDRGEIAYFRNGKALTVDLNLKRRITLVLPKVGIFNTTVFKNVAYGLRIRGVAHKQVEEKVGEILDFVHLGSKGNQSALTLSSGETQRLGIARALVIEPEVIFLDEPTASVDQKNVEIIENLVLKMRKERNATVVITTHDKEQAERLEGSLLTMRDGKIVYSK
jgi:tungstate transport system ATP-binding protein